MGLHLVVINQGNLGVEDLDVSINIKGNLLRGDSFHQRIDYLGPGERRSVIHRNIFGFGKAVVTIEIGNLVFTESVFLLRPFTLSNMPNPLGFLDKLLGR